MATPHRPREVHGNNQREETPDEENPNQEVVIERMETEQIKKKAEQNICSVVWTEVKQMG